MAEPQAVPEQTELAMTTFDRDWPPTAMPNPADRAFLLALRTFLRGIAEAHGLGRTANRSTARAVHAALDGAHLTARTELLLGDPDALHELIPGFTYLVVLPLAGESAALRAAEAPQRGLLIPSKSAAS